MLEVVSQLVCQKAEVGAVGKAKHSVLMYWLGLPGFVSVSHPGPVRRFGKAQGSLLFSPCGSPSVPNVAVNGTPSLTLRILPSCQPFTSHASGPESELVCGTCQAPLSSKMRPILKSDNPRFAFKSNHRGLEMAFANVSPVIVPE